MNLWALLGIVFIIYTIFILYVVIKKPVKIWEMKKIQAFRKSLGERGTVIFFIVWGLIIGALGIYLFTL